MNKASPAYICGAYQTYAWGRKGFQSSVARMVHNDTAQAIQVTDDQPYAELWYGTHASGPSMVITSSDMKATFQRDHGTLLSQYLGSNLPFILKVLSINGALSLQAHPDLTLAKKLHESAPQHYKDPNHKPELVVALTPMHVLCGFRPIADILALADAVPEFATLLGDSLASLRAALSTSHATEQQQLEAEKRALSAAFATAMRASTELVAQCTSQFAAQNSHLAGVYQANLADNTFHTRFPSSDSTFTNCDVPSALALVYDLIQQYPADVGAFGPLFLNYFTLSPRQSVFLGPNEPHAYLFGDCIEAMACSDNVVRAGLTPKFRDVDALVTMLTYSTTPPAVNTGIPVAPASATPTSASPCLAAAVSVHDEHTRLYAPPTEFPEFMVARCTVRGSSAALHTLSVPSIALCAEGCGQLLVDGAAFPVAYGAAVLVPAGAQLSLQCEAGEEVLVYRASANVRHEMTSPHAHVHASM